MFIRKIAIQNFRLFRSEEFEVDEINIPDNINVGSGLTVFVGENGCGKTALLEAIGFSLLSYKSDSISLKDFNDPRIKINIRVLSDSIFNVSSTMPKGSFKSKGFSFEAGIRRRNNQMYLSSLVVSDQKYLKADGETKPNDNSPDLRVSVNNPFKGIRFNETDILFLDKNRTFQVRSGTYNSTRFDRLMEDFDYQYISSQKENKDIDSLLADIKKIPENQFFMDAVSKFQELSGNNISLNLINNLQPFSGAFFAEKKTNDQQIPLDMIGSGYEMIFAMIYSFYLSRQSGKKLIILIDEAELHLHPSLQKNLVNLLLDFSKVAQIILTTHSPLLVKQLLGNNKIKLNILSKKNGEMGIVGPQRRVLPYMSANEINYIAFGLANEEYHNELYGLIQGKEKKYSLREVDDYFLTKGILKEDMWIEDKGRAGNNSYFVTKQTYIRNSIHHPENKFNAPFSLEKLKLSIDEMRSVLFESSRSTPSEFLPMLEKEN